MTKINVIDKPRLKNPILIEGLPGIGNVGRIAVNYMISELNAKHFASLYSKWFFPFVVIKNKSNVHMMKNDFYYYKNGKKEFIFLTGDCQSITPNGHYEVVYQILNFVKNFGVKEIITIGGIATGSINKRPIVFGVVTHKEVEKKYKKCGINFNVENNIGYIVGATGLLLGVCKEMGMRGIGLLAQTLGFPISTDPRAAERILKILIKMLNIHINLKKLDKQVKEMEKFINRIEALQRKALMDMIQHSEKKKDEEHVGYIG